MLHTVKFQNRQNLDRGANICRNAAATAFRLGCRITTGTPFPPQNVYRNGVPVLSGTTTPLILSNVCVIFGKTTHYGKKFQKFFVRYLPDQKIRLLLKLSLLCGSHPKSVRANPTTFGSFCSRFHPNRFTFD